MVINCMKMEAEIYGMIPSAKIEALENEPGECVKQTQQTFFGTLEIQFIGINTR